MIPVLAVAGGLWYNWFAAKELDDIATVERTRRPISDFWSGILLGAILGLWTGVNHGETLKSTWSTIDRVGSWVLPTVFGQKRLPDAQNTQAPPGQPPMYQGQQPPLPPGQQPMVYYQQPPQQR